MSSDAGTREETKRSLAQRMEWLIPSCQQTSKLVSLSMDEPLSARQRLGVMLHTMMCKWCRMYQRQLLAIRKHISEESAGPDRPIIDETASLNSEARERIRRALGDSESGPSQGKQ